MKNNRTFLEKLLDGAEVEWKPLGEVAKIQRGASPRPISQYITDDPNGIPWIKIGDTTADSKYIERTAQKITPEGAEKSRVLKCGDFVMSNSMSYGRPYILKISGAIHDGWASISDFESILTPNFLYYYLSSNPVQDYWDGKINSSSVSNLNSDIIKSLPIPIPPLPVQTKIVKILDALTALTSELTSELILRRKQYEYYREKLLNIDGMNKVIELGDVGPVRMCKRILKNQTASSGDIPFYKIGTFGKKPDAYISNELFQEYKQKYSYPKKGDILISASGTIGRTVIFDGENSYFQDSNIVWIDNDETLVLNKYLYHFYKIAKWGIAEGGTIQRLYNDNLKKVKISIPPLKEQHRIVSILDKFETLTNSITEGLPLAIEQSQKRYEYYRELLLNFNNT